MGRSRTNGYGKECPDTQTTKTPTPYGADSTMLIEPNHLYTAGEVAELFRFDRTKTVYEIPEVDLPRIRVGRGRRQIRFLGTDLLAYLGLEPNAN